MGDPTTEPEPLTDEQQARRRQAVPEVMRGAPFMAWTGLTFDRYEPDDVVLRLPFREDLTNDGVVYHGGVIASALDTAGSAAAWSNHDFDKGVRASTVSLSIQYVGAAKRSDLVCRGRTVKRGRELTFVDVSAADADGNPVAHGVLTYRIV
jgi:uncharacterized protein (TIGR00369 family)